MKLTIDNVRYPKIEINNRPHSIPQNSNAKISYPNCTKTCIPQLDNKRLEIQWAKAYFPYLTLCHSIGLWNFIYVFTATTVIGVWDLYRNIAIPGGKRVQYIPKWKRKQKQNYNISKISLMVKLLCQKTNEYLENKINNLTTVKRQKRRQIAVNKQYYNKLNNIAAKRSTYKISRYKTTIKALTVLAMTSQMQTMAHGQKNVKFDTDSKTIGVDNRCSACITCDKSDFVSDLRPSSRSIKGFGGTIHNGNIMTGTIQWNWCDDEGISHKFNIPNSYYVPDGGVRLLSPQHWAKAQKDANKWGTCEHTSATSCVLYWKNKQFKLTIPLDRTTNVATVPLAPGFQKYNIFCMEAGITNTEDSEELHQDPTAIVSDDESDEESKHPEGHQSAKADESAARVWEQNVPHDVGFNLNGPPLEGSSEGVKISIPQTRETMPKTMQDMMKMHQKMNHIPFEKIKELARQGAMDKAFAKCDTPICVSCQYSKMIKRPWRNKSRNDYKSKTTPKPGEVVSVDQMVSSTHGFVAQMTGILTKARYKYATVYVDQGSRLGYVYLQTTATAEETIKGKIAFELHAKSHGINIQSYHADNGIFRANKWVQHCQTNGQTITYAGVNAHHQNGIAERRIRELQDLTRTMLIHAARRWPECITANLWPYALRLANDAFNHSPNLQDANKRSPMQIFGNTNVAMNPKHFQPFGCPVFVLDNQLQHNAPFQKWKERSKVGIYLGRSPTHGANVSLVLDRMTGLVSPQFHIKHDPSFHMVMQDKLESQWQNRAGFIKQETTVAKKPEVKLKAKGSKRKSTDDTQANTEVPDIPPNQMGTQNVKPSSNVTNSNPQTEGATPEPEGAGGKVDASETGEEPIITLQHKPGCQVQSVPKRLKTSETTTRQVQFDLKTPQGSEGMAKPDVIEQNSQVYTRPHLIAMTTEIRQLTQDNIEGELLCLEALFPNHKQEYNQIRLEQDPLYAYKATSDPDTMYLHQAMQEKDADQFKAAMIKEVNDQMKGKVFSTIPISEVPEGKTILPAVWQMRRKRDIKTKEIKKYKARLNIDGSRMIKGQHYDETYAPVASWKFIRLLLIMVAKYGWYSRQLDYVLAFPQAPVEREIYMKIPKGFKQTTPKGSEEQVLKIHRNIYGQKQAGRVWYQYLRHKLIHELKFTQSKIDECVFYRGKTLYVLYTDDSLLAGPDNNEIEQIIKDLKKAKLDITDEGDIQDFLGVNIDIRNDGTVNLTQPHLIDQILKELKMSDNDNMKLKDTPAKCSEILKRAPDGKDFDKSFHYRSIIGKINYLEKATRCDIAYINHQCARFTENPKDCHAKAIRWLAKYLKATRDRGTILKPQKNKGLEVYVDADFSGNWDPKAPHMDRDTARSRHGYIIMYEGCPLLHKSQLQTEIALSSTESEYIGISYALRDAIPIMNLLQEMRSKGFPVFKTKPKLHCKVFEDNSGALEMAKTHKYRPRTKHLNIKLHHFRDYVTRGDISIHKIDTKEQIADILTKPVSREILEYLRPKSMGW
jgi:hypothetical protein